MKQKLNKFYTGIYLLLCGLVVTVYNL